MEKNVHEAFQILPLDMHTSVYLSNVCDYTKIKDVLWIIFSVFLLNQNELLWCFTLRLVITN